MLLHVYHTVKAHNNFSFFLTSEHLCSGKRYIFSDKSYTTVSAMKKLINQLFSQLACPFTLTGQYFMILSLVPLPSGC